jgi:hypothetical protein
MQSASEAQLDLQAPPLHTNDPQLTSTGVMQAPAPSQAEAGVCADLEAHTAFLQFLPLSTWAQAPALHEPVVPQVDGAVALHWP